MSQTLVKDAIIKERPKLSESSVKTYTSILNSLHSKIFGKGVDTHLDDFKETKKILDFLKDVPPNRRKTTMSALVILTNEKPYRDQMNEDVLDYNHQISKQECTETQKDNWVTPEHIRSVFNDLEHNAGILYKKKNLKPIDLQAIQDYIMMSVSSGIYIPPRRLVDWCSFKLKDVNKQEDNYLDKNTLVFNKYKTAKFSGQQTVECPKDLKVILTKWSKFNPTPYLLFDTNMNPLNPVKLNQRFNKIFGAKVSVNNFRHSFLTAKFGHILEQKKQVDETMKDMGSSSSMLDTYVKKGV